MAKQFVLLATPWLLLSTNLIAFRQLVAHLGPKLGYLGGFLFYWIAWCVLLPWWVLGTHGVLPLFRAGASRFGRPAWAGTSLLVLPCLLGYGYAFPRAIRHATGLVLILSAVLALVNGALEELLWRGTYLQVFRKSLLLGYLYPSLGFALWHFAPLAVTPAHARGGNLTFVAVAGIVGLMWG